MDEREWEAWAVGDDPDAPPPGIDPYPPDDFSPQEGALGMPVPPPWASAASQGGHMTRGPVAPRFTVSALLDLRGTEPPTVELSWHIDDKVTVIFRSNNINQFLGLIGSPTEVRLALTKGLAAIDRAESER